MKKLILAICIMFFVSGMVFAQSTPDAVLTDTDVKAFVKNHEAITDELEQVGISIDDSALDPTAFEKAKSAVTQISSKYGLKENGVEKISAIAWGSIIISYEHELDEARKESAEMEQMMKKMMGQQMTTAKRNIHSDDLKIIEANKASIIKIIE